MKAQIVSFHCVLKNRVGKVISSTFNRDVITQSELPGQILRGLAETLQYLQIGEKKIVFLTAEEAYGLYDPELVMEIPLGNLAHIPTLHVGYQFLSKAEGGGPKLFRVIRIDGDTVT